MDIERELKLALASESDYRRVCELLPGFVDEIDQSNYYFDTPDRSLQQAGILLRIRLAGARAVVTAKGAATRSASGFFQAEEWEAEVDADAARRIVDGDAFAGIAGEVVDKVESRVGPLGELERWGMMTNRRRRYQVAPGVLVEVDRTDFGSGRVDWEIEVEHEDPDRVRALLDGFLDPHAIATRPQTTTKSERLKSILEGSGS